MRIQLNQIFIERNIDNFAGAAYIGLLRRLSRCTITVIPA